MLYMIGSLFHIDFAALNWYLFVNMYKLYLLVFLYM